MGILKNKEVLAFFYFFWYYVSYLIFISFCLLFIAGNIDVWVFFIINFLPIYILHYLNFTQSDIILLI